MSDTNQLHDNAIYDADLCLWVDPETGEVLGIAPPTETDAPFVPTTPEQVEWVLQRIARAEANMAAVDGHPDVIAARAILDNAADLRKRAEAKRTWLLNRFESDLKEFAKTALAGEKGQTWRSVYGSIALRTVPAKVQVVDSDKALAWAEDHAPDAVKYSRSFLISKAGLTPADELPDGFTVAPASVSVTIKTGI
jgi:hypothetical protein